MSRIEPIQPAKAPRLPFALLLVISYALFNLGLLIDQTIRWTDHWRGFQNGVAHILAFTFSWCFACLPWSLIIYALNEWKGYFAPRAVWVLAFPGAIFLATLAFLVLDPPTARARFKYVSGVALPATAQDVHASFSGGFFADHTDIYYFRIIQEEMTRLLEDLQFKDGRHFKSTHFPPDSPLNPLPGCPDFRSWSDAQFYSGEIEGSPWFFNMIVNDTKTEAYVIFQTI